MGLQSNWGSLLAKLHRNLKIWQWQQPQLIVLSVFRTPWFIVTQVYGGALSVAIAQNVFSNKLLQGVTTDIPGVDPQVIIDAGATDLQNVLTPDQLAKALVIFMDGLKDAFVLPIVFSGIAFFLAMGLTKDMRVKRGIKLQMA
jgi:hypothetical protein